MKRLIAAAVLVFLIILICIISSKTMLSSVDAAYDNIEKCEELFATGDFGEAKAAAYEFKKNWKTQSRIISLFSNHSHIDNINLLASTLPDAAQAKNSYEFNSAASRIKETLDLIYTEHSFTLESLY